VDERDPVRTAERAAPLELVDPRSLARRHGAANRQLDHDFVAAVKEPGRLEHLVGHRVLHDVHASPSVFGETERAQHFDNDEVPCRAGLTNVLDRDWLGQATRRPDDDRRRAQLDSDARTSGLIAAMRERVRDRLPQHDRRQPWQLVAACPEHHELVPELVRNRIDGVLQHLMNRAADFGPSIVVNRCVIREPKNLVRGPWGNRYCVGWQLALP
jgi:hypothetical protein